MRLVINRILILCILLPGLASFVYAQNAPIPYSSPLPINSEQMGMGGLHVLNQPNNGHVLIYNPALLAHIDRENEITPVQFAARQQFFDFLDFISEHGDDIDHYMDNPDEWDEIDEEVDEYLNEWQSIYHSPYVGFNSHNFGIAFGDYSKVSTGLIERYSQPMLLLTGYSYRFLAVGIGQRFVYNNRYFSAGASLKMVQRRMFNQKIIESDKLKDFYAPYTELLNEGTEIEEQWGVDLGITHTIDIGEPGHGTPLDFGIVLRDLFIHFDKEKKDLPELTLATMYHYPLITETLLSGLDLGIEYKDALNREGNGIDEKICAGVELKTLKDYLNFRVGLYESHATLGVGLQFAIFRVAYSSWVDEINGEKHDKDTRVHMFQFSLVNR